MDKFGTQQIDLTVNPDISILVYHATGDHGLRSQLDVDAGQRLAGIESKLDVRALLAQISEVSFNETLVFCHQIVGAWCNLHELEFSVGVGDSRVRTLFPNESHESFS